MVYLICVSFVSEPRVLKISGMMPGKDVKVFGIEKFDDTNFTWLHLSLEVNLTNILID